MNTLRCSGVDLSNSISTGSLIWPGEGTLFREGQFGEAADVGMGPPTRPGVDPNEVTLPMARSDEDRRSHASTRAPSDSEDHTSTPLPWDTQHNTVSCICRFFTSP